MLKVDGSAVLGGGARGGVGAAEKPRTAREISALEARLRALGVSRPGRAVYRMLVTLAKPPAHPKQIRDVDHECIAALTAAVDDAGELVRDRLVVVGYAYPTAAWLAGAVDYSTRTVFAALAELEQHRLLYKRRLRNGCRYFPLVPIPATALEAADDGGQRRYMSGHAPAAAEAAPAAPRTAETAVAYMVSGSESSIAKQDAESSRALDKPQFSEHRIPAVSLEASELVTDEHRTLARERGLDLDRCVGEFLGRKRNGRKVLRLEQYRTDLTEWLRAERKPQNRAAPATPPKPQRDLAAEARAQRRAVVEDWVRVLAGEPTPDSIAGAECLLAQVERQTGADVAEQASALRLALDAARPRAAAIAAEHAAAALARQRDHEAAEAAREAQRITRAALHGELSRLAARHARGTADAGERARFRALLGAMPEGDRVRWAAVAGLGEAVAA